MDKADQENTKVSEKTYSIVLFLNEKRKGKQVIELVPKSWLTQETGGERKCYYPPKNDLNVSALIEQAKPPNLSWPLYKVNIIKTAAHYDQGLRRLERACFESNVESTSADDGGKSSDENNDPSEDVSSTSSSPKRCNVVSQQPYKRPKHNKEIEVVTKAAISTNTVTGQESYTDSEDDVASTNIERNNRGVKRKKTSEISEETGSAEIRFLSQVNNRIDKTDERIEKFYKSLSKQIKGAKQSVLYDLNKKMDAIKNTIIVNRGPGLGKSLRKHKETLGISLPIEDYDAFIQFDTTIQGNEDKETALKEIMADFMGAGTDLKQAVRKILGGLITKAVQELYSGTGKKGPNGVTKKSFSGTHLYACMKDIIQEHIESADGAAILSTTSRYLSGAGDREGGKARRDAKKVAA